MEICSWRILQDHFQTKVASYVPSHYIHIMHLINLATGVFDLAKCELEVHERCMHVYTLISPEW